MRVEDRFNPDISNSERALLGMPLLVRLLACCPPGDDTCKFTDRVGALCIFVPPEQPHDHHPPNKRYRVISLDKSLYEHYVHEIEILP